MISLALVDDHVITRKGLKTIIELHPDIKVVYEASNGLDFLNQLQSSAPPDVAIVDINMPILDGFSTIQELHEKYPQIKVIAFSLLSEDDAIINIITKGACGYINKSSDPSALAEAVVSAHTKGFYLSDLVKKEYFRKEVLGKKKLGFNGKQYLSPKEVEFIKLSATNLNYKEIADIMKLSPKTIENYRDSLFEKLAIKNRAALTLFGIKNGLVSTFP